MAVDWTAISKAIADNIGHPITLSNPQPINGGCINQTWKVASPKYTWFIKLNKPNKVAMFKAELLGLEAIIDSHSIRAPQPLCAGETTQHSFLVMEHVQLIGSPNPTMLGEKLANMHRCSQASFGWHTDNTIGSTPQINTPSEDWVSFWKEHRLRFQLNLALRKGLPHHSYEAGMILVESVEQFFTTYQPSVSLLHGDLWSGNCAIDENSQPVIYDPAVYYGDREADLAMTELFGGFGSRFFDSYHDYYPIDEGYSTRKTLYNLYHILNHFNLFGGNYATQATRMIHSLVSELR